MDIGILVLDRISKRPPLEAVLLFVPGGRY